MVGWHHWFDGHEFEQALGDCLDREGQGSLACRSPWSHKESDTTEQLNSTFCCQGQDCSDPTDPALQWRQACLR